ncbi:MAG: ribonuclease P protein component [Chitinophagaceae bacterium]|nr:ribonuclease P protein component [Chitinophagaceae bacterium]
MKDEASSPLRFTFKKEERLSSKKLIDELFNSGSSFYLYPFKVLSLTTSASVNSPVQVLMAVSSKNFPKAVDRNRLKRITREAYRLNKSLLHEAQNIPQKKLLVAFIYTGKKMESFELIHQKMTAILIRLSQSNAPVGKNTK